MNKKKILLIDDEVDLCKLIKLNLEYSGEYEVTLAFSGNEGLEKANHSDFDLIITDFKMPGIDGKAVLDSIKLTKPHLPIILFSMFFEDGSIITQDIKKKANGLISKPIDIKLLIKAIKEALCKTQNEK